MRRAYLVPALLIVLSSAGAAANINVGTAPTETWITDTVDFTYDCKNSPGNLSTVDVPLDSGSWASSLSTSLNNITYKANWTVEGKNHGAGGYTATFKCSLENGTTTNSYLHNITVKELSYDNVNLADTFSDDSSTTANLTVVRKNGTSEKKVAVPDVDWQTESGGNDILDSSSALGDKNKLSLDISDLGLDKNEDDSVDILFNATYNGESVTTTETLDTKDPAQFSLGKSSATKSGGELDLDIDTSTYHGSDYNITESDLEINFDGSDLDTGSWSLDSDTLTIDLPQKDPSTYDLKVTADIKGVEETDTVSVLYPVTVKGRMLDGNAKPLSGRLVFSSDSDETTVNVGGDGSYKSDMEKGNYTLTMKGFRGLRKAKFYGLDLESDVQNLVSYDRFGSGNLDLKGFRVAGGSAFGISKSFSSATIQIEYDDTAYSGLNEQKLEVMKCSNWNFGQRHCNGEWEKISDYDLHSMGPGGYVTLKASRLSAFIIGETDQLTIKSNLRPDKKSYYLEEEVQVQGTVEKSSGDTVKEVKVKYKMGDSTGSTTTDKEGIFSFTLETPSEKGGYDLTVSTEDAVFRNDEESYQLDVNPKKELTLELPDNPKLAPNKTTELGVEVVNSGQATLTDISVDISGLQSGESYSPRSISALSPGGRKTVQLSISTGSSSSKRKISVTADAEEASTKGNFLLLTGGETKETTQEETSSTETTNTSFPALTIPQGALVTAPSLPSIPVSTFNTLSIVLSILIIAFFYRNLRSRERERRDDIISLGQSIQEEITREGAGEVEGFECDECGRVFDSKRGLGIHRSKKHG